MSPSTAAVNCAKFIIHTLASNEPPWSNHYSVAWMERPCGRSGEGGWRARVCTCVQCVCAGASPSHLSLSFSQQGVCVGGSVECLDLKGKMSASIHHYETWLRTLCDIQDTLCGFIMFYTFNEIINVTTDLRSFYFCHSYTHTMFSLVHVWSFIRITSETEHVKQLIWYIFYL